MNSSLQNVPDATISDENFLHFPHVKVEELSAYPDGLSDIQTGKTHGFLIRGVFSADEADKLVEEFYKVDDDRFEHNKNGRNIPKPFASVSLNSEPGGEIDPYFAAAGAFWDNFPEKFGIDFSDRVKKVFEKISGGRPVGVPQEPNKNISFSPAQMREMYAGKGGIYVHCGKYFRDRFSSFYTYLKDVSIVDEQISYFVMLQPPDSGGELTVYDILYNNVKQKNEEWDNKIVIADDGTAIDLEDPKGVRRRKLRPGKGDMIVFDGGNIWHRVEDPEGSKNRVTAGGFMTFSHDNSKVYFWG